MTTYRKRELKKLAKRWMNMPVRLRPNSLNDWPVALVGTLVMQPAFAQADKIISKAMTEALIRGHGYMGIIL